MTMVNPTTDAAMATATQYQARKPLSAPMAQDLSQVLSAAHLSHYESALRELGCEMPDHLADLEEQDLVELGMKKVEAKRLLRTARA